MELKVPISPETEAKLHEKAAAAGVDIQTFAGRTLERIACRPSVDELLAPPREEFDASGLGEDALIELLEKAKHEMRDEQRARRAS